MALTRLSIVIPVYNGAHLIERTLIALIKQLEAQPSVEVVISDNHSGDATEHICKKYSERFPNHINYYRNTKNYGAAMNIYLGGQRAKGEYIWLLGDDIPTADAIDHILNNISNHPSIDILIHQAKYCLSEADFKQNVFDQNSTYHITDTPKAFFDLIQNETHYFISSLVIKTEFFQEKFKKIYCENRFPHVLLIYKNITSLSILVDKKTCVLASPPAWLTDKKSVHLDILKSFIETVEVIKPYLGYNNLLFRSVVRSTYRHVLTLYKTGEIIKFSCIMQTYIKHVSLCHKILIKIFPLFNTSLFAYPLDYLHKTYIFMKRCFGRW